MEPVIGYLPVKELDEGIYQIYSEDLSLFLEDPEDIIELEDMILSSELPIHNRKDARRGYPYFADESLIPTDNLVLRVSGNYSGNGIEDLQILGRLYTDEPDAS